LDKEIYPNKIENQIQSPIIPKKELVNKEDPANKP
jgi:hypothetical protein